MASDRRGRPPTFLLALVVPVVALVTVVVTLDVSDHGAGVAAAGAKDAKDAKVPNTIDITNFQYSPDPLMVRRGRPVEVTNHDGTTHTVTADDKSFDTGDLEGGASATITMAKAGTYRYFCNIHNYMTGTIEVR